MKGAEVDLEEQAADPHTSSSRCARKVRDSCSGALFLPSAQQPCAPGLPSQKCRRGPALRPPCLLLSSRTTRGLRTLPSAVGLPDSTVLTLNTPIPWGCRRKREGKTHRPPVYFWRSSHMCKTTQKSLDRSSLPACSKHADAHPVSAREESWAPAPQGPLAAPSSVRPGGQATGQPGLKEASVS